jgi:hypothetical protein
VDHDGCKQPVFQKLSQRERRLYEKLNSLFGQVNLSKIKEEEKKEEDRVTAVGTLKDKVELLIKKLTEDILTCASCLITLSPDSKGRHRTYCHPQTYYCPHCESFDPFGSLIHMQTCRQQTPACTTCGFHAPPLHDCLADLMTYVKHQAEKLTGYPDGVLEKCSNCSERLTE